MNALRLYNTAARREELFQTIEPGHAKIYSCGPTVYAPQHIGNLRSQFFADLLKRTLLFAGYRVTHVINITDVGHLTDDADDGEDKLELAARSTGRRAVEIARHYTGQWSEDRRRLGCLEPDVLCKATEHIPEQIDLACRLEARGYTYRTRDGLYFDTSRFPRYADFAGLSLDAQVAGARATLHSGAGGGKRHPADFALWKLAPPGVARQQEWDSPWGRGFPGWHLECSAMSSKYLGARFDLHTGGVDHIAVHHTNEIAQSESATGHHPWVRYWLHNDFLLFEDEKMAKSKGRAVLLNDLVQGGAEPLALRYFFLMAHYRAQQSFSERAFASARAGYRRLRARAAEVAEAVGPADPGAMGDYGARFRDALCDDLNAPRALAVVWEAARHPRLSPATLRALFGDFDPPLALGLSGQAARRGPSGGGGRDIARSADRGPLGGAGIRPSPTGLRPRRSHPRTARRRGHPHRRHPRRPALEPVPVSDSFRCVSSYRPGGDQPAAIRGLVEGLQRGDRHQTLLGVTGSGKSFTMACVIEALGRPTLVMAPNKTLAAQLYTEFSELFPDNAVEYFVSYYDYYQPEAYIPASDTYIEKDSSINDEIDKMRHATTHALLTRRDVLVVASVSCIYGLGAPATYGEMHAYVERGATLARDDLLRRLVDMLYRRNDTDFHRGTFRVRGDVVEVFPQYEDERAIRIEFFGDEVESIAEVDPLRGRVLARPHRALIYPASHYVASREILERAVVGIRGELRERLAEFGRDGKLLEAQRLEQRTRYDLELLEQMGFCHGVENYSRWLDGRSAGQSPYTLFDYFPKDFLLFLDESHITAPQVGGMYRGDRARKETLVQFGFRLPSALDNRPLRFDEWYQRIGQAVYVSATPGDWELEQSAGVVVEQVIRPTGLTDPEVEVRAARGQVDDLLGEVRLRAERGERVLVTTLTKRMAEELTEYYTDCGVRVRYLHSDIQTIERTEIIRQLREGRFDVLVGINLLREGLDLPEVSLVAILDADKEGFLRSTRSLIQTIGRAARNVNGTVILYADRETASIRETVTETARRRALQERYNKKHRITPKTVQKRIASLRDSIWEADYVATPAVREGPDEEEIPLRELPEQLETLRREMRAAARELDFERAATLRDRIRDLEKQQLRLG